VILNLYIVGLRAIEFSVDQLGFLRFYNSAQITFERTF
jgi:hypothetical protein